MKPFIIITGPQAVGKMAVGMALREKYGYRLFHNHMTIELVNDLYGVLNKESWPVIAQLRETIFSNVRKSSLEGFIFTYMWGFNLESEHTYVEGLIESFEEAGWTAFIVELEADVQTRLDRNKTELRLENKATKRNIEWSDNELQESMKKYRLNSHEDEIKHKNYIRINNTHVSAEDVADIVYEFIQKS